MLTRQVIDGLSSHWAIAALGQRAVERAVLVAHARLIRSAISQLRVEFADDCSDDALLRRAATAFEVAAAEGLSELIAPSGEPGAEARVEQSKAAAFRTFELRRALPVPRDDGERVLHVLHLAALGYCADRWADVRRWLLENRDLCRPPQQQGVSWDLRVLFTTFDCWVRLLRKQGWGDLSAVAGLVATLRAEQSTFEPELLSAAANHGFETSTAWRLVSLYHWAKATELLASYMMQGEPPAVLEELDKHFERARGASSSAGDVAMELLLRWLHAAARRMAADSIWSVTRIVNSRVTRFVENLVRDKGMFELLPPQRAAIQKEGLLDPARRAIVVDLPTSGGKTALAEFRILQALNQFEADRGWVAYVAPTRALVAQLTRRLRQDLTPLKVYVEQLAGAVEVDAYEEALLSADQGDPSFHVLVSTPEKLQFVIRNKKVQRPLVLLVLDEAHNIEDLERGLRIELLLATVRRDCPQASFLLLTPSVPNASELASWLGQDAGTAISLSTTAWRPNELVVGMFGPTAGGRGTQTWGLWYETLVTSPGTIHVAGRHSVGGANPLPRSRSTIGSATAQTAAIARVLSERGTVLAVASTIPNCWQMARLLFKALPPLNPVPDEVALVQRFLKAEVSPEFELVRLLSSGIGVHHAGLSDEARSLIEWLTETGRLRVLCATSTVSQGINFPVSSVVLASRFVQGRGSSREMSCREFWNLAGRAGRFDHGTLGFVGIRAGQDPDGVRRFVRDTTHDLVSRLQTLVQDLFRQGHQNDLTAIVRLDQWADFRAYIAHLWRELGSLDAVLEEAEQTLRNTLGYSTLRRSTGEQSKAQAKYLLDATREYARTLSAHPENAMLADATGFAPEGVSSALLGLTKLGRSLTPDDWRPSRIFGDSSILGDLVGIMLRVPDLKALQDLTEGGRSHAHLADLTLAWVHGRSIQEIALQYFGGRPNTPEALTEALCNACKAIYKTVTTVGAWGIASLTKLPGSGLNFDRLSDSERREINNLAAMVYYGVGTDAGVLMRMQSVPRTVAVQLGDTYAAQGGLVHGWDSHAHARRFVEHLSAADWQRVVPTDSPMSGADYEAIWRVLSGKSR